MDPREFLTAAFVFPLFPVGPIGATGVAATWQDEVISFLVDYWWVLLLLLFIGIWLHFLLRRKPDIGWKTLDSDLQWDANATADSLKKIYDYVVSFGENTIAWYRKARQPKRRMGVSLRLGALILTAAAALVPLAPDSSGIDPVWTTVLLAAAGVAVSVDILLGHTSGWVRYMLAQHKVERQRDGFLMEWNALKAAGTDAKGMLERARTFLLEVGKVVDDETQEWATEFQNALKEMEKARKEAAEVERTGAVEVSVKNPQDVAGWTLEIDGSQRGHTTGIRLAVTDVRVGIRRLKAYGEDEKGNRFSDESTLKVEGGATVEAELELS